MPKRVTKARTEAESQIRRLMRYLPSKKRAPAGETNNSCKQIRGQLGGGRASTAPRRQTVRPLLGSGSILSSRLATEPFGEGRGPPHPAAHARRLERSQHEHD